MQETVASEKLNEEQDKQIHLNPIPSPVPGNFPDNTDNSSTELEPVITPDEFNALEKNEDKKKLFGFLKSLKKTKDTAKDESGSVNDNGMERKLNDLMLKIEKLEGKFEMLESSKSEHGDRMSNLSEEIGELRSLLFSREETFGIIESEFEKIKEATAQIRPEKIAKDLESYSKDLMKAEAQAELEKSKIERLENELRKITEILDKIKSYENILEAAKDIKKQVDKINDSEKYTGRMAAKAEKIFGELDSRLMEFQKYKKEIDDANEMIKDVVKSVDGLEIKIESLMPKDSFSKVKDETDTKIRDVDTRLKRLKDIVAELIDRTYSHKSAPIQDLDALKSSMHNEIIGGLSKIEAMFEESRKITDAKSEDLEQKIRSLSGALLSLESNTEAHNERSATGAASGLSRISSLESRIRDQSSVLEKEIHDAVGTLGSRLDSVISSEEILDDRIGYLKESIDHAESKEFTPNPEFMTKPAVKSISQPIAGNSNDLSPQVPLKDVEKHEPVMLPIVALNPSMSLQAANDFVLAKNMNILFDQLEKQSHAEKPITKPDVSVSAPKSSSNSPSRKPSSSQSPQAPLSSAISSIPSRASSAKSPAQSPVPLDIGARINSLKMLLAEKEKKINLCEAGESDISEERILIDNASLHLGMAELDLLDGNEIDSLQKIEKVKALLEK